MALTETFLEDEIHPIDIVEHLAEHHEWEFDRIEENQIAMAVQGQWRTYSITLAWSGFDETLRLICSFEMEPPEEKLKDLYETLNVANDRCWTGAFTFWEDQKLMVYRYGLVLTGGQTATADQIDAMISSAVLTAEKYYPAFQLVVYDNQSPNKAMQVAIAEAYGHA
ncbi:MAG: diacylglyceryl transferase [Rhodobacteraceae bacterium]|nr:diacylglyceryl transferase [Paracoccaceae bacterium]